MSTFDDERPEDERAGVLANSAVMAAGTVFSRMSGFIRSALLAAALGPALHADLFNIANTIPNMVYILVAGGVINAVLVPQLVRTMRSDPDGGDAYLSRIVTLAALFLGAVTLVLIALAPWAMDLFLDSDYSEPELADQRQSIIDFARFCLPQVFFYGMFVLVGQILNARGRFGPMMWAPIANNIISVGVLVTYLVVFGPARGAEIVGAFTPGQELLLGLGATLGIVAQFAVLVPYLRAAGVHYRPRFDFLHTGLGHTMRLAVWTVLFVVVNQIAYTVVVHLASGGTASDPDGTGYTVYQNTFLIMMVPHSVVTVSLATAILPRMSARAASDDRAAMSRTLAETLRTALSVVLPFALLLPVIATDLSHLIWGYGASSELFDRYAPSLALFGIGLVFFTVHYLVLRGFYALEMTRTVFWIQCAVAGTNIVVAMLLVREATAAETSPALVLAYSASYLVGSCLSYAVLRRLLGGLHTPALVRFLVRMAIVAGLATAAAAGTAYLLDSVADDESWILAVVRLTVVGAVDAVVLVALARAFHVRELTSMIETITRRVPVLRRP
ncbi:murein biosynthesis integral membrane protein MurJ [Nocardioides sp. MAH-18]|uniref:Murein biosynthesis integral membrane protein MurJ n=1 Tax=Nocardioides agri TaxID=2682843 RepID=A0A6L6XTE3_9ACTN|nr:MULTISPECIES: murein biosynthesis integral membrane protein MurJ [unclassified Nocardioides]MBA2955053.1 murein biosynthesis integral membrane protein MurJ [Nocardioides sp. CGMCC 1.13656]MVQ49907.1 murein biosynthesis integral membrane protein MurJ [Nocardioides sp. MAH-18]